MTRPRGYPPTPRAASSESEPDEIASRAAVLSMPPRRMMEPLPNCFSICDTARSRALLFSVLSSAIGCFLYLAWGPPASRGWYTAFGGLIDGHWPVPPHL